jgi:hypothetical protein
MKKIPSKNVKKILGPADGIFQNGGKIRTLFGPKYYLPEMEKSVDWNEKCPVDAKRKLKSFKKSQIFQGFLGFKKKKINKYRSPNFLICCCMVIEDCWKKIGQKKI